MNNIIYKLDPPDIWADIVKRMTNKPARIIVFQVTENCNMACTYCYQHNKSFHNMSWDVVKTVIDETFNNSSTDNWGTLIFDFIGGEPLLEIDLIEKITTYTIKKMLNINSPWLPYFRISICSNGLLYFNEKVQNFFKKYNYFIDYHVSIDGNQELHDSCRIDQNKNPTYQKVMSAIKHCRENYKFLNETKMTISPDNIQYLSKAIINLINEQYNFLHCNCIFEEGWNYNHAKILYNELKKVADYLIDNNLTTKHYVRFFEEESFDSMDENNNNNWCGGVCKEGEEKNYYAIKYTGEIFPCIRYMNSSLNGKQPELPIGNIFQNNNFNEIYQENFKLLSNITRRSQSTDECFYCPIASGCSWCSGYNYEKFGTPNKRATYICCMHQARFLANVYYWNKLYKKLNINKIFNIEKLPKEKILKIIDEQEYNYLLNMQGGN